MSELNQNQMNARPKPKAPLVLFIISILILVGVGGYLVYAKSLGKTAESINNDTTKVTQSNNTVEDSSATTNVTDPSSTVITQIPDDWKSYTLTACGVKIFIPANWTTDNSLSDKTLIFNSPSSIENKKKDWLSQWPADIANDLTIRCYESLDSMTSDSWKKIRQSYPEFPSPIDLYDVLTRKDPTGGFTVFITQDVEKINIGAKDAIKAIEGGEIMMTNYYFQNINGQIVEFHIYVDSADGNLNASSLLNTIFTTFSWL